MKKIYHTLFLLVITTLALAQTDAKLLTQLNQEVKDIEPKMIGWRRFFH